MVADTKVTFGVFFGKKTAPTSISFLKNRLERIARSEKNINNIKNMKFDFSFFIFYLPFFGGYNLLYV